MFYCQFCDYKVIESERSLIHEHHIIPKEIQNIVDNKRRNLVFVCPNCHNRIYIPSACSGIHSIKKSNSIIINKWIPSTGGRLLEYIEPNGNVSYVEDKNPNKDFLILC